MTLELEWFLRGAYRLPREALISAFEGLLAIRKLLWVRSEGCAALISFDRCRERLTSQLQLSPGVQVPPPLVKDS